MQHNSFLIILCSMLVDTLLVFDVSEASSIYRQESASLSIAKGKNASVKYLVHQKRQKQKIKRQYGGNQFGQNRQNNQSGRNVQNQTQLLNGFGPQIAQNQQNNVNGDNVSSQIQVQEGFPSAGYSYSYTPNTASRYSQVSGTSNLYTPYPG